MPYFQTSCSYCFAPIGENGKATRTMDWCEKCLTKTNSIKKVAGKKVVNHGGHVSVTPSFGGSTGHKAPIHGSGF